MSEIKEFDAIKLSIASPEEIISWSHGEVTKPETINYRTQKPERDGLFCERIFGPTKDWECYCGKYKKIRYKGVVCEKCGVEVTRSLVRRERMGHIKLAAPVTHIWYLRGTPSRIGLMLDISIRDLERVVYFGGFIVTDISEPDREKVLEKIKEEFKVQRKKLQDDYDKKIKELKASFKKELVKVRGISEKSPLAKNYQDAISGMEKELKARLDDLENAQNVAFSEVKNLSQYQVLSEIKYRDLSSKYGSFFQAEIGAEAIYGLLSKIDLDKLSKKIKTEISKAAGQRKRKLQKRLKLVESFRKTGMRPEWMILVVLPVIPPDLRPMVQLDGGRFATSDLNDLYRRVINRNNRLRRLLELQAPEVICRNEKRMLQEAVDALIDNEARRGKAVITPSRRKLKSLSDVLRGKQGRFRQNLLGKRVDYSGRSVIVVGPELKLHQCGLPKRMALELFKPFIVGRLIKEGYAHNVKSASRMIERSQPEVWDMLEKIISEYYVLLNRAPTLHRLGIQAFQPVLVEGSAIQIHPLVCTAFNADFDGDQMAVHVPLSVMAQWEAKEIMRSTCNLLKPADGTPVVSPSQDMVLGCYFMTKIREGVKGEGKVLSNIDEAIMAYRLGHIHLQAKIKVRINGELVETSVGRILFNQILPKEIGFQNKTMKKSDLKDLVYKVFKNYGSQRTVELVDKIKEMGFEFATSSGLTISLFDVQIPSRKHEILKDTEDQTNIIRREYKRGLITERERAIKSVELWTRARDEIEKSLEEELDPYGSIYSMVDSGARGSLGQVTQLGGMKGLVVNPAGDIIELPIKSNFREGFSVLEYFISMHGARKGKSDTALRTSDSGYLTRRLVDVAQDVVVSERDCGDRKGLILCKTEEKSLAQRIWGRVLVQPVLDKNGKVIFKAGELIDEEKAAIIEKKVAQVAVRSPLTCQSLWGVCQQCYGVNLATGKLVELGEAVGIIAAQSIGEPGTQLTMRTFHAGGVAGEDITHGLPRVEELFEARSPKGEAVIAEIDGIVTIDDQKTKKIIKILGSKTKREYVIPPHVILKVKNNEKVVRGQQLTEGHLNLQTLYETRGQEAVWSYIINEVQDIYISQGQTINDKHLEIIIRQMFSKVRIKDSGDTEFLPGEIVDKYLLAEINQGVKNKAKFEPLILGITKVALLTPSVLSAASFQETTRVLVQAATSGAVDKLRGLKENVIIGRLIPAGTGFNKKLEFLLNKDKENIGGKPSGAKI